MVRIGPDRREPPGPTLGRKPCGGGLHAHYCFNPKTNERSTSPSANVLRRRLVAGRCKLGPRISIGLTLAHSQHGFAVGTAVARCTKGGGVSSIRLTASAHRFLPKRERRSPAPHGSGASFLRSARVSSENNSEETQGSAVTARWSDTHGGA